MDHVDPGSFFKIGFPIIAFISIIGCVVTLFRVLTPRVLLCCVFLLFQMLKTIIESLGFKSETPLRFKVKPVAQLNFFVNHLHQIL